MNTFNTIVETVEDIVLGFIIVYRRFKSSKEDDYIGYCKVSEIAWECGKIKIHHFVIDEDSKKIDKHHQYIIIKTISIRS